MQLGISTRTNVSPWIMNRKEKASIIIKNLFGDFSLNSKSIDKTKLFNNVINSLKTIDDLEIENGNDAISKRNPKIGFYNKLECPCCGQTFRYAFEYCFNCGQRIVWHKQEREIKL